jgi:hypothetical protein
MLFSVALDEILNLEAEEDNNHYANYDTDYRTPKHCISVHSKPLIFSNTPRSFLPHGVMVEKHLFSE